MFFSVVIPTCNRVDSLSNCINSLMPDKQRFDQAEYEIIVTDDGNSDNTRLFLGNHFPTVKWVKGPSRGPAANRNNGARAAIGKWLIFIDDDVTACDDLLNNYKKAILQYKDILAFEGAIFPDNWSKIKGIFSECPVNTEGGCFWTANVCILKSFFIGLSGFDEDYTMAAQEDQDFYLKIKRYFIPQFVAKAIVIHPVRKITKLHFLIRYKSRIDNYIIYINKNHTAIGYTSKCDIFKKKLREVFSYSKFYLTRYRPIDLIFIIALSIFYLPYLLYKVKLDK